MNEILVGSEVKSIDNGPVMTVSQILNDKVLCKWTDYYGKINEQQFELNQLVVHNQKEINAANSL